MIKTDRLILKPYEDADQSSLIALYKNDRIKQTYMLPDFTSEEQAVQLFKRMQELTKREDRIDCGIYLGEQVIGFANTVQIEGKQIEIGYVIAPEFQNQGYATEMLQRLIQELFAMGYDEVLTGAFEENLASRRVMEKSGMTLIEMTEELEYRGKTHHCVYYSKKRREA